MDGRNLKGAADDLRISSTEKEDLNLFSKSNKVRSGVVVLDKQDGSKGKVIFSLNDLPLDIPFMTANGNELTRKSSSKVTFKGKSKTTISCFATLLKLQKEPTLSCN